MRKWQKRRTRAQIRRTAVIVLCYGNYDARRRTSKAMDGYMRYIEGTAKTIQQIDPQIVVVSGGKTRTDTPISEAASVWPALREALKVFPSIMLEEESQTTVENVRLSLQLLADAGADVNEVVFICDRVRGAKMWVLAWKLCHKYDWQVRTVARPDDHPHSRWAYQLLSALRCLMTPADRL